MNHQGNHATIAITFFSRLCGELEKRRLKIPVAEREIICRFRLPGKDKMRTISLIGLRKSLLPVVLAGILLLPFLTGDSYSIAQGSQAAGGKISAQTAEVVSQQRGKYFTSTVLRLNDGKLLEKRLISGPPKPPSGRDALRSATALPVPYKAMGINTLNVPGYDWVFGCSAVSASMIAAFYDRNGFPNMYTGPTGGGVMPMDNSIWGAWTDSVGDTYPNIPLAASHKGVDGRTTKGSIDDYWISYGSSEDDPFITGPWPEHAWGDAVGDYMKTSQSTYDSSDGSTWFYTWDSSPDRLTCDDMENYGIDSLDGTYGRKLFYEARGYTVTDCYSQSTDNIVTGGFSFAQFKAEIDAGRPVMLNLAGHTIVGLGYNDEGNTVYIHDTWSYDIHSMNWGASYEEMPLQSVSIVNLRDSAVQPKSMPWLNLLLGE